MPISRGTLPFSPEMSAEKILSIQIHISMCQCAIIIIVKIVSDYYTELMSRCPDGKMEPEVMTMIMKMMMVVIRTAIMISLTLSNLHFNYVHIFMFSHWKEFKKIFRLAFPERPEDKLELLTTKVANVEKTDGKIREQPNHCLCH